MNTQKFEISKRYFLSFRESWDKSPIIKPFNVHIGCPICKEGNSKGRKQRFNLFVKDNEILVHCYNCGYSKKFKNFLREFDLTKFNDYIREIRFFELGDFNKDKKIENKKEIEINLNFKDEYIPNTKIKLYSIPFDFKSAKDDDKVMNYLKSRKIDYYDFMYTGGNFTYKDKTYNLDGFIVNVFKYEDKIYGLQARHIEEKRFLTLGEFKIFNYFNVNRNKRVYVFESIFDMLSNDIPMENKIATLGASFDDNLFKDFKDVVFALDNPYIDKTTRKLYMKLSKKSKFKFVLYKTKFKDWNDMLKAGYSKSDITKIINDNILNNMKAYIQLNFI